MGPPPGRPRTWELERLAAKIEVLCNLAVTVEDRGGVPQGLVLDTAGMGCTAQEVLPRLRAALGEGCAYGAWVAGPHEHLHIGPARPGEGGTWYPTGGPHPMPANSKPTSPNGISHFA